MIEEKKKMQEDKLLFSNCTMMNKELFFVDSQYGLPAKMNLDNRNVSYCGVMENFILKEGDSLYDVRTFGNKVYALGISGRNVILFDLEKLRCQYIPLKCAYHEWGNFVAFEQYGFCFYIFPRYGNKICVLDTHTQEIEEITDYFDGAEELQCGCRADDKVWLIPSNTDKIGCYDLSNGKMQIYGLGKKIEDGMHAVFIDGSIYILNRFGIIYIWNVYDMKLKEIKTLETERLNGKSMCKMVYAGNKLILLPGLAEEIKILDLSTGRAEVYHDYPADFFYYDIEGWSKYLGLCEDDSYYYCAMRKENYLLKICKRDGMLSWIKPNVPSEKERMKVQKPLKKNRCKASFAAGEISFLETDVGIKSFLREVPQKKYVTERTNMGKEIFEKVKQSYSEKN